jgi:YbbR domain-containing protein
MRKFLYTKDFFKRNLVLKIAAFVCAVGLFVVTPENQDLYRNEIFTDIPLHVIGADELFNNGLVLTEKLPSTVKITLSGRVSTLREIDSHDLEAIIDLSTIERDGEMDVSLEIEGLDFNPVEFPETPMVTVNVDTMVTTFINLTMDTSEETEREMLYSAIKLEPKEIKIRGSKTLLDTISKAVIYFEATTIESTIHQTLPIHFLDVDGKEIDTDFLYVDDLYVDVLAYPYKSVTIYPNFEGEPQEEYMVTQVTLSPESVMISGDNVLLETIDKIDTQIINLMGANQSIVQEFMLNLPEGIQISSGQKTNVSVFAVVEEVIEKKIIIVDTVEFTNLKDGFEANLENKTKEIVVRGPKSEIAPMTSKNIKTVIDMVDAKKGTHDYNYNITLDAKWAEIIEKPEQLAVEVTD